MLVLRTAFTERCAMKLPTVFIFAAAVFAVLLKLGTTSNEDQSGKTDQQVLGHNIALLRQLLLRRNSHKRTEEVEQQATDDDVTRLISHSYKRTIAKRNSLPTCDSCSYPEIDSINATSTNKTVNASNKKRKSTCAPYEIPVRLPNNILPDTPFVPLHRCLGSDDTIYSAFGYRCKATSKETVRVQYKGLIDDGQIYEVAMHNHTSCKLACHMTTSCGPNKILDKDNCHCKCPLTQNDCSKGTILNSHDCECRCAQTTSCHTIYEKYNMRTCKCECDQRLKDICRENRLSINPQNCACI